MGCLSNLLSKEFVEWVEGQGEVHLAAISKVRSAVDRVLVDSELQGVWEDSGDSSWKLNVEELVRRLV
jgi:hypothetical protein